MRAHVSVRQAQDKDLDGLANLAARSFRDTFAADNDPSDMDQYLQQSLTIEQLRVAYREPGTTFLIAVHGDNDAPVGYAQLCTTTDDPCISDPDSTEIERLYADKSYIGRGVGAALMQACLTAAIEINCTAIWLGVWEQNDRAISFYERWGFETVGTRLFQLGADVQTDLVMVRRRLA